MYNKDMNKGKICTIKDMDRINKRRNQGEIRVFGVEFFSTIFINPDILLLSLLLLLCSANYSKYSWKSLIKHTIGLRWDKNVFE